ncbi:MAG: helicase RepA family protein [Butyricicoccus sp.]|nr:helicase RepA family protein [Butyricicoccus sp.]
MKQEKRLQTIGGATLMAQPLRPPNFIVDTLLSQGLHILAGSPKVGKSWLALWLAVTVAKGEPVWGLPAKQGTTLYLCLEDSQLRIQNRLFEITEDAPANVHFSTKSDILGRGLEQQLNTFLTEHPDTVLVIIDTLQIIRSTNYDNTYANDYRELELRRNTDNVWEVTADSYQQPELLGGRIVFLLSALLKDRHSFIGTPTELVQLIDPDSTEGITPKNVSLKILQSVDALSEAGITAVMRRSNGKRLVDLRRAESADDSGVSKSDPVDPAEGTGGGVREVSDCGE